MAAIYHFQTAETLSAGLQGSNHCDEARRAARNIAAQRQETVVLEDDDGNWAVAPDGSRERLPDDWA